MSVRMKETNTLFPLLLDDVSIYMNALPIGGREVAPLFPAGDFVLVYLAKIFILPLLFLSLHTIFHHGNRELPLLPAFITDV